MDGPPVSEPRDLATRLTDPDCPHDLMWDVYVGAVGYGVADYVDEMAPAGVNQEHRVILAAQTHCPPEILARMLDDKNTRVAMAAFGNRSCPQDEIAKRLENGRYPDWMGWSAIRNPCCSSKVVGILAISATPQLSRVAVERPDCPEHIKALLTMADWDD